MAPIGGKRSPDAQMKTRPILAIVGPTGVGKTALSELIAEQSPTDVVSADSRQVYRELSIGTATPSLEMRKRIPHHFVQEKSLGEPWTAGRFAHEATERIHSILERGARPLVVGGSTLYLEALLFGLADVPAGDPAIRKALTRIAAQPSGAIRLYEELLQVDPEAASRLDATKTQRLVRALEIVRTTGRTWSSYLVERSEPAFSFSILVLNRSRESLYTRINDRVDRMLNAGLLEENMRLISEGYALDTNPLRTIGYQEPLAYLRGQLDYETMVETLKRNTRRYAKRQLTWFRRWEQAQWINLDESDPGRLAALYSIAE